MKKINLKGISEILSEKELKNVMGGSDASYISSSCKASECDNGKVQCWGPQGGAGNDVGKCKNSGGCVCGSYS